MPRRPRVHIPGGLYHAIFRGNHRQAIFHEVGDYLTFERLLARCVTRYDVAIHAYCWMPNHVHLAIQVGDAPLGRFMQSVSSVYARLKQRNIPTTGHLFERRYWASVVDANAYLLTLVRYIHRNPVRAGIVQEPADYRWSSHGAYLGRSGPDWLTRDLTFGALGCRSSDPTARYRRFMAEAESADDIDVITGGGREEAKEVPVARPRTGCQESRSLDDIIDDVAAEHGLTSAALVFGCKRRDLVSARLAVARRALAAGVGTLATVAARLGRSSSSLSEQLNKKPKP